MVHYRCILIKIQQQRHQLLESVSAWTLYQIKTEAVKSYQSLLTLFDHSAQVIELEMRNQEHRWALNEHRIKVTAALEETLRERIEEMKKEKTELKDYNRELKQENNELR